MTSFISTEINHYLIKDICLIVVEFLSAPIFDLSLLQNNNLSIAVVGKSSSGKSNTITFLMQQSKVNTFLGFGNGAYDDFCMLPRQVCSADCTKQNQEEIHQTLRRFSFFNLKISTIGFFWSKFQEVSVRMVKDRKKLNLQIYTQENSVKNCIKKHEVDYWFLTFTNDVEELKLIQNLLTPFLCIESLVLYMDLLKFGSSLVVDVEKKSLYFMHPPLLDLSTIKLGDEKFQKLYEETKKK
jgi:hypothetical protein